MGPADSLGSHYGVQKGSERRQSHGYVVAVF